MQVNWNTKYSIQGISNIKNKIQYSCLVWGWEGTRTDTKGGKVGEHQSPMSHTAPQYWFHIISQIQTQIKNTNTNTNTNTVIDTNTHTNLNTGTNKNTIKNTKGRKMERSRARCLTWFLNIDFMLLPREWGQHYLVRSWVNKNAISSINQQQRIENIWLKWQIQTNINTNTSGRGQCWNLPDKGWKHFGWRSLWLKYFNAETCRRKMTMSPFIVASTRFEITDGGGPGCLVSSLDAADAYVREKRKRNWRVDGGEGRGTGWLSLLLDGTAILPQCNPPCWGVPSVMLPALLLEFGEQ